MHPPLINSYSAFLQRRFGRKVRKVAVDAGFSCPNRDGTISSGGCTFCSNHAFSPGRLELPHSVEDQVRLGIAKLSHMFPGSGWLVYFQSFTNTYSEPESLCEIYSQALNFDGVVGLAIGTRPDCLPDETLQVLERIADDYYVQLEIGLQSANDATLKAINRGHGTHEFIDATNRAKGRGFTLCAHMIVGLPGEGMDDYLKSAALISSLGYDIIKIHSFHLTQGSAMADAGFDESGFMTLDEYAEAAAAIIERLPPEMVVERVAGTAYADALIGPEWCSKPALVRSRIEACLKARNSWHGKLFAKDG
ncbi:MAG: TIGR01212 family radical SAM protein [Planctomycetes bacterium]|nr:TIGR01212 family radical SAM protein [Planctomycetota bacterium]